VTLHGGVYQLADRVGRNKAIELTFLSEVVEAKKLAEWNVVNRVVDDANLETETGTLVQRLASGPPQSYAATPSHYCGFGSSKAGLPPVLRFTTSPCPCSTPPMSSPRSTTL
jgi:enoyl-CoA hydratase/carnithine racemase